MYVDRFPKDLTNNKNSKRLFGIFFNATILNLSFSKNLFCSKICLLETKIWKNNIIFETFSLTFRQEEISNKRIFEPKKQYFLKN